MEVKDKALLHVPGSTRSVRNEGHTGIAFSE
jgi:hypothetical protein